MAFVKGKGIRVEVTDCIKKRRRKKKKSSLISVSESVLVKIPTKLRISAMFCRSMVFHDSHSKKKTLSVCEFDHGPFKQFVHMLQNCKIWTLLKILNETID